MKDGNFSQLADMYHRARRAYPLQTIEYINELLSAYDSPNILDLGCGTGKSTRQLATAHRTIIGCDRELDMIKKAVEHPTPNTSYCLGEAAQLPFSEATFDAVTAFGAFHWIVWSKKEQALAEIKRVLKQHGSMIVVNKEGQTPITTLARQTIAPYATKALPEARKHYYPDGILKEAGFLSVVKESFSTTEHYTLAEAVLHLQSMSAWNLVHQTDRPKVLEKFETALRHSFKNNQIIFKSQVIVVSGKV